MIPVHRIRLSPIVFTYLLSALFWCPAQAHPIPRIPLHKYRTSSFDLEIGGDLANIGPGQTRFVRYVDLRRLPQRTVLATGDANFSHPVHLSGVSLDLLPGLLRAKPDARMITAQSVDRYKTNYPVAYLRVHHPILILRIEGQPPSRWAQSCGGQVLGPYIISQASFTPAFRVLGHEDEPQIPWGVVRLDVRRESTVYAGIEPKGLQFSQQSVQQGYAIARQNCFRCHNERLEGGFKAGRSWEVVARRSVADPRFFDDYVKAPTLINSASRMAASPAYDEATLSALRDYFALFAMPPNDFR